MKGEIAKTILLENKTKFKEKMRQHTNITFYMKAAN